MIKGSGLTFKLKQCSNCDFSTNERDEVPCDTCYMKGNLPNWKQHSDTVNSPSHYKVIGEYEAIDIIESLLTPEEYQGYLKGNILKYALRADKKNGMEDYAKMGRYNDMLFKSREGS